MWVQDLSDLTSERVQWPMTLETLGSHSNTTLAKFILRFQELESLGKDKAWEVLDGMVDLVLAEASSQSREDNVAWVEKLCEVFQEIGIRDPFLPPFHNHQMTDHEKASPSFLDEWVVHRSMTLDYPSDGEETLIWCTLYAQLVGRGVLNLGYQVQQLGKFHLSQLVKASYQEEVRCLQWREGRGERMVYSHPLESHLSSPSSSFFTQHHREGPMHRWKGFIVNAFLSYCSCPVFSLRRIRKIFPYLTQYVQEKGGCFSLLTPPYHPVFPPFSFSLFTC